MSRRKLDVLYQVRREILVQQYLFERYHENYLFPSFHEPWRYTCEETIILLDAIDREKFDRRVIASTHECLLGYKLRCIGVTLTAIRKGYTIHKHYGGGSFSNHPLEWAIFARQSGWLDDFQDMDVDAPLELWVYALMCGHRSNRHDLELVAHKKSPECLAYLTASTQLYHAQVCAQAAWLGSIASLIYAHRSGHPWDEETCESAVRHNSFRYPLHETRRAFIALACLRYAHTRGCPLGNKLCKVAAGAGSLECLAYGYQNGADINVSVCEAAARGGSLACLEFAYRKCGAMSATVCSNAVYSNSVDCLKFALEHGARPDVRVYQAVWRCRNPAIIALLE